MSTVHSRADVDVRKLPELTALAEIARRCNEDSRFSTWGCGFEGHVVLVVDEDQGWMQVRGGRVLAVGNSDVEPIVRIAGTGDDWRPIIAGQQGGLHRAWRHQQLTFDGNLVALMRHYKMFWRLGELIAGEG